MLVRLFAALTATPGANAETDLYFDKTGTDQAAFGPNEIITISGNVTYFGRADAQVQGGVPDSFFPISDLYIIPKGTLDTADHGVLGVPLHDVRGVPHTIRGVTGGEFFEEVIGVTAPQGTLKAGEYDIVVDEHQNRFFDLNYDFYLGGEGRTILTVFIPSNVPILPNAEITAMKQDAQARSISALIQLQDALSGLAALAAENGHRLWGTYSVDELYAVLQFILGFEVSIQFPDCPPDLVKLERNRPNMMADAIGLFAQTARRYSAIAADPADPDFAQLVTLSFPAITRRTGDPLDAAALPLNRALQQESALADALLRALEKYQGAKRSLVSRARRRSIIEWC